MRCTLPLPRIQDLYSHVREVDYVARDNRQTVVERGSRQQAVATPRPAESAAPTGTNGLL